ncbi:alpha-beta hydrolase superfamily lysophospholipase [Paraburkholderia sp. GAS199]|uniref:alpha/beta hydrolase n=1 Tax=Paraburkholderia sp. GAS199 TaxID=3035126 RepID=UPI003D257EC1
MRVLSYTVSFAVAAYLIAALALYLMQDDMLLPSTPKAADLRDAAHTGSSIDLWHVRGNYAGYIITPTTRQPRGTFIVFHGNEESAETKLPLADVFVQAGYRVLVVEYPGHGNRPGERTMQAALDASRDALADTVARWPGPVYLAGESLGAGMASQVVRGQEAAVAGVVLITPWDSLASVAAEKYPVFPVRLLLHDGFDSVAALSRYHGPLVIIGAQQDTLIPVMHARRFAGQHDLAKLMLLPNADHDSWFDAMTPQRWQQVMQWMGAA